MTQLCNEKSTDQFSRWWAAYFLLLPFGQPLTRGLVIGDLPAIALMVISFAAVFRGKLPEIGKTEAWFIFLTGCSLLGIELTRAPDFYLKELTSMVFLFVCFKITADFLNSEERLAKAIELTGKAAATLLLINSVVLLSHKTMALEFTSRFFSAGEKLSWPFEFSGQLGISLTVLFPLTLCARRLTGIQRAIIYSMMLLNTGAIASRSVFWLSMFQVIYIEFFVYAENSTKRNIFKLLLLACAAGLLVMFFGESYSFQRSLGQLESSPLIFDEPRVATLREALRTLPTWLQGYGLGCFKAFHELEIHNTPLSLLVETGFAGFLAATAFIASIFIAFWRSRLRHSLLWHGLLLSLIAVMANGMFRNLVSSRVSWFILALCLSHRHFQQQASRAALADTPTIEPQPQQCRQ